MSEEHKQDNYIVVREGGVWSLHCRSAKHGTVITLGSAGWPSTRIKWFLQEGWIEPYAGPVPAATAPPVTTPKKAKPVKQKKGK